MKRREFAKYLGLGSLISILPASAQKIFGHGVDTDQHFTTGTMVSGTSESGKLVSVTKPVADIIDSVDMNQRVRKYIKDPELLKKFSFISKTPVINCVDDEIQGRVKGRVFAADIISDDEKSTTYQNGAFEFFPLSVPRLKIGSHLSESIVHKIYKLSKVAASAKDYELIDIWKEQTAKTLAQGLLQRMNALMCAMYCNSLNYDRIGIMSNADWGMPQELKI